MRINKPLPDSPQTHRDAITLLLKEAKKLHRAATSESNAKSLPVLRRLIHSKALKELSLVELNRQKNIIQRKHILHMLALEANYDNWANYRHALENTTFERIEHYAITKGASGYPNLWFSSLLDARDYAAKNGGRPIPFGSHAMVIEEQTNN